MALYKSQFDVTMCCDECGEMAYALFDCPTCGKGDSKQVVNSFPLEPDAKFKCDGCGAEFTFVNNVSGYASDSKVFKGNWLAEHTEKVCFACTKADLSESYVADFTGEGKPYLSFHCEDCCLVGPYDRYNHQRVQMFFNPFGDIKQGNRFWVDGGQSSECCKNFEMRDDHGLTGKAKEPK